MESAITVRHCRSHEDLKLCVDLQRRIWGYGDEDMVPAALFVVAQHTGGHALCAFDGEQAAGFALSFSAEHHGDRYWHSHMVGVLPEYQNRGVGRTLKLAQRGEGLREGIGIIRWTFDPLELRNGYFNLCRLGAVIRQYLPNCYGLTTSPLHGGLPTDRFVAEWRLDSPRVAEAVGNALLPPQGAGIVQVALPTNLGEIKQTDPGLACQLQTGLREQVTGLLAQGYAVTGFARGADVCHYLLERYED